MRPLLVALAIVGWTPAWLHAQTQATQVATPAMADEVIIRPGDMLRIGVWPDDALGGEFPVEESGYAYLPIIGEIQVGNVSLQELRTLLRQGYATAMKDPVITVTPLFRVSVVGAVQRPGLYSVDPTHTLFDVISLAGGFRADADERKVRVLRESGVFEVNASEYLLQGRGQLAMAPQSGDRIVVPEKRPRRMWSTLMTVMNTAALAATIIWRVSR